MPAIGCRRRWILFLHRLQVVPTIFRIGVRLRGGPAIIYLGTLPLARDTRSVFYVYPAFLGVHQPNDRISSVLPVVLTDFRHFNNLHPTPRSSFRLRPPDSLGEVGPTFAAVFSRSFRDQDEDLTCNSVATKARIVFS